MNFGFNEYIALFVFCLTLSTFSIPVLKKVAFHFQILDIPSQAHKTHTTGIPYLGGISIVIPITLVTLILPWAYSGGQDYFFVASLVVLPALFLSIVGLIDDINNLSPFPRFVCQLVSSSMVSIFLSRSGFMTTISENAAIDFIVSVFWMVGITNALNFIDNLDGGAAGVVVVASLTLFVLALVGNQSLIAAFSLAIVGSTLGFLWWNKSPATIYLGDSGSLFLGMILSVLLLQYEPSNSILVSSLLTPILIMALPIIDTTYAVSTRISAGRSPFQGGRDHLSHVLIDFGFTRKNAAFTLWGLSALFSLCALLLQMASGEMQVFLTFLFLVLIGITFIIFKVISHRSLVN